jgi:hypothetical protein
MPEIDMLTKLSMIAPVGALVGAIVLYHVWLDGRLVRERGVRRAGGPKPAGEVARGSAKEAR